MLRYGWIIVLGCLLAAGIAWAETKIVILKDGGRLEGEVTETEDGYQVLTLFGPRLIPHYKVEKIITKLEPREEFDQRREQIKDDDADGHLELGRWAMTLKLSDKALKKEMLELAKQQFQHVLELRDDDDQAKLLIRRADGELERLSKVEDTPPPQPAGRPGARPGDGGAVPPESLVPMEDVFRIRLAEVRFDDAERRALRIRFVNNVLERFASMMEGVEDFDGRKFQQGKDARKLQFILDNIGRENQSIRNDIQITSEPKFMRDFQRPIWPMLRRAGSCADSGCHAAASGAGGFRLLIPKAVSSTDPISVRSNYTNFLVLDSFVSAEGLRLIDRSRPAESLILQYGLPPEKARSKHPLVQGMPIKPFLSSKDDRGYEQIHTWIRSDLHGPVHPLYNLNYVPPFLSAPSDKDDSESPEDAEGVDTGASDADASEEGASDSGAAPPADDAGPGPDDEESPAP